MYDPSEPSGLSAIDEAKGQVDLTKVSSVISNIKILFICSTLKQKCHPPPPNGFASAQQRGAIEGAAAPRLCARFGILTITPIIRSANIPLDR